MCSNRKVSVCIIAQWMEQSGSRKKNPEMNEKCVSGRGYSHFRCIYRSRSRYRYDNLWPVSYLSLYVEGCLCSIIGLQIKSNDSFLPGRRTNIKSIDDIAMSETTKQPHAYPSTRLPIGIYKWETENKVRVFSRWSCHEERSFWCDLFRGCSNVFCTIKLCPLSYYRSCANCPLT